MSSISHEAGEKPTKTPSPVITLEDAIALFSEMMPSAAVKMRREMEQMFPSIIAAIKREVCEEQIIAALRKKWPGAHVATLVKLLNVERDRRLAQGEPIECKPFGSPRKPKTRTVAMTNETRGSSQGPQAVSYMADADQREGSA